MHLLSGTSLAKNQIVAMFQKKIRLTLRSWILMILQILIPASFIILTVLSERTRTRFMDLPLLEISLPTYINSMTILEKNPNALPNSLQTR